MNKLLKNPKQLWQKVGIGMLVGVFAFGAMVPQAKALTASELLNLLIALDIVPANKVEAAKKALGESSSSNTSCVAFTRNLTVGSSGADVVSLQTYLEAKGFLVIPTGVSKGYFGPLTKNALAKYQASVGIAPSVGYFGPITNADITAKCKVQAPGNGGGDNGSNDDNLSGGAGSIESYKLISTLSNEDVGEGEEDVEVAGIEIEVDNGSDILVNAVRLNFDKGSADRDFRKYADEVSIYLDGKEFGRVNASKFTDDNSYSATIALKNGAIIKKGDEGELTVAISALRNIDSNDLGETWSVDFEQIRFKDAQGSTFSEDPNTASRTFTFESFSSANDSKLKISQGDDDINESRSITVDATDKTKDVVLASYVLKAEGKSDLEIKKFGVNIDVTGASHVDHIISGGSTPAIFLEIDGKKYGTASYFDDSDGVDVGQDENVLFNKVNYVIDAGEEVEVLIKADLLSVADNLDEGDTISVTLGETETDQTNLFNVEDESGEDLTDNLITGNVLSGPHSLYEGGIQVELVSKTAVGQNNDGADNDTGTFTMVFDVTAFGKTIYVGKTATATTSTTVTGASNDGIIYMVSDSGTATTDDLADLVTFTKPSGVTETANNIKVNEGKTTRITLTVTQTNDSAEDDGIYYMSLKGIGWTTDDDTTYENMYNFNLHDFQTTTVYLN